MRGARLRPASFLFFVSNVRATKGIRGILPKPFPVLHSERATLAHGLLISRYSRAAARCARSDGAAGASAGGVCMAIDRDDSTLIRTACEDAVDWDSSSLASHSSGIALLEVIRQQQIELADGGSGGKEPSQIQSSPFRQHALHRQRDHLDFPGICSDDSVDEDRQKLPRWAHINALGDGSITVDCGRPLRATATLPATKTGNDHGTQKANGQSAQLSATCVCFPARGAQHIILTFVRQMLEMSRDEVRREGVRCGGGITPLIALLECKGTMDSPWCDEIETAAAGAIAWLAMDATSCNIIREANGISPLANLLGRGVKAKVTEHAARAISNLARNSPASRDPIRKASLHKLVALLANGPGSEVATLCAVALCELAGGGSRRTVEKILSAPGVLAERYAQSPPPRSSRTVIAGTVSQGVDSSTPSPTPSSVTAAPPSSARRPTPRPHQQSRRHARDAQRVSSWGVARTGTRQASPSAEGSASEQRKHLPSESPRTIPVSTGLTPRWARPADVETPRTSRPAIAAAGATPRYLTPRFSHRASTSGLTPRRLALKQAQERRSSSRTGMAFHRTGDSHPEERVPGEFPIGYWPPARRAQQA
jgi:hypothetical protein